MYGYQNRYGTQDRADRAKLHLQAASDALDRRQDAPQEESLSNLVRSMVAANSGMREKTEAAAWRRADRVAAAIDPALTGAGGFCASPGRRDCFLLPYAEARAMVTSSGPAGGYATPVQTLPPIDPLWQDSISGTAGVTFVELTNNAAIPRGTGAVTTTWHSTETTAPAAVDAPLGSVSAVSHLLTGTVKVSLQLVKQAGGVQDFLVRLLLRSARQAIDRALLSGTGASGQPLGIANWPTAFGIQEVAGGALAWAGILEAQRRASASGVSESRMTWIGAPTVRETLGARERITTAGKFIWDDGRIAGSAAIATPDAPASTLIVGDFSQVAIALFGPGVEIRFDPNNDFDGYVCAFQVAVMADIVPLQPTAFVRVVSIT